MGNDYEEQRIRNRYAEEIARIEAMRDDNERKREIERFVEENKLKKYMKEIKRGMKRDQIEHEEKMEDLSIKRDDMQRRNNKERRREEKRHQRETKQIENNYIL